MRKFAVPFAVIALTCLELSAETAPPFSISSFGTFIQDFDTLASTGSSSSTPEGWGFAETGTNANITYSAGTGSSNSGETFSFGATGSTERAFGGLLSGSVIPTIGAHFKNETGGTITTLTISYTGEQWRLGASGRGADRLDFQYSTTATSLSRSTRRRS